MGVTTEEFDPTDIQAYHEVMLARYADDRPKWTAPTLDEVRFRLRTPFQGLGPARYLATRLDGELVAFAGLNFPAWPDTAMAEIVVHPRSRRRGVGTALLRAVCAEFEARGLTSIECWQVTADGDGARWAENRGFRTINTMVLQGLAFAEADNALWDVPVPSGYRLAQWTGVTPDDLLASYALARNAIHDAPTGEQNTPSPTWTPVKVREAEQDYLSRGAEQRVVVALAADGSVAGMTELELHDERPGRAFQQETSVLPAHRGHDLGRAMKAHMIEWVRRDKPRLTRIDTGTSTENAHMQRVNRSLGFETIGDMISVNARIEELRA
ncbi:GNAT family N-acetyltransferase [Lentzea sp. NPDC003310]|uniref:GNAT family N-acetyltransferase n=1 Tax=Lentzea sp. NPDC003310 TaxID=3154447 RepID=UPI0033BE11F7